MQTRQIVPQSGVPTLHSGHVGLADDLTAIGNVIGIDFQPIRDIEEAFPYTDHGPQRPKTTKTVIWGNLPVERLYCRDFQHFH